MAQRSHRCEEGGRRAARRLRRLHRADRVDEPRWLAQPPPTPTSSASSSSSPLPASLLARSSRRIRSRWCLLTAASTACARDAARRLSSLRRTARAALSRAGAHPPGCRCCGVLLLHRQRRVLPFYLGLRGRGAGRLGAACAPPCRLGEHTQLAASQPVAGCLRSSSTPKGNTTATSALSSTLGRGCKASHCPRCAST